MKEKGNISIEEIIELGIAIHYTTQKTQKERDIGRNKLGGVQTSSNPRKYEYPVVKD